MKSLTDLGGAASDKYGGRVRAVHMISLMTVICVFAISALVLLNVGVRVYRNIAVNNLDTFELRTSVSFVATKIHQSDAAGRVYLSGKEGNTVLVMEEELDGFVYETILYHYDGALYELYQEKGTEYELSDGMEILSIASFSFFEPKEHLIQLTAGNAAGETETMYVAIRSESDSETGGSTQLRPADGERTE